jgi:hypothetical protein
MARAIEFPLVNSLHQTSDHTQMHPPTWRNFKGLFGLRAKRNRAVPSLFQTFDARTSRSIGTERLPEAEYSAEIRDEATPQKQPDSAARISSCHLRLYLSLLMDAR